MLCNPVGVTYRRRYATEGALRDPRLLGMTPWGWTRGPCLNIFILFILDQRRKWAHRISRAALMPQSLAQVYLGEDVLCDTLDKCRQVSLYLLEQAEAWLGDNELGDNEL